MKARIDSTHVKLYKFTYSTELPENLCPYFWKLVFAVIMFIPNFILQLPMLISRIFVKDNYSCNVRRGGGLVAYFCILVLSLFIMINYHLLKAVFNCYSYDFVLVNFAWIIDLVIIAGVTTQLTCNYYSKKQYKYKEPSIIKEFIKAKYGKYCPKIDWIK